MQRRRTVRMFMTPSPITIERTATMARAMKVLEEHGFRHLPIVDGGGLVGIVTESDFVRAFARLAEAALDYA